MTQLQRDCLQALGSQPSEWSSAKSIATVLGKDRAIFTTAPLCGLVRERLAEMKSNQETGAYVFKITELGLDVLRDCI